MRSWSLLCCCALWAATAGQAQDEQAMVRAEAPTRLAWVKHVGGCDPGGMAVLPDGGVYVTGAFWGPTTFGKGEPGETKLAPYGERDIFLARFRPDGSLAWVKQAGGRDDDMGNAVAAMPDGGAVITGKLLGRAVFGAGEAGQTTTWAVGRFDAFVARFRADGGFVWCRRVGGELWNQGQAVVAKHDGSVLAAGNMWGQGTFGLGEKRETTLKSAHTKSYFLACYTQDGSLEWAHGIDVVDGSLRACLGLLRDGGAVLTGPFLGEAVVGPDKPDPTRFVAPAGSHMNTVVAKYQADGSLAWAKTVRPTWIAVPSGVAAMTDGGVTITGRFNYKTTTFGVGEPAEVRLTSDGDDLFLARYRPDGTLAWVKRAGGKQAYCWGKGVAGRPDGGLVSTGYLRGVATFGPGEAGEVKLSGNGRDALFMAWYRADGTLEAASLLASDQKVSGVAVSMAPDGALLLLGHFTGRSSFRPEGGGGKPQITADSEVGDLFLARYESVPLAEAQTGDGR